MMSGTRKSVLQIVTALVLCAPAASPAVSARLSGSIVGIVRDNTGIPQMGATVLLLNRYERVVQKALTNERGAFGFGTLSPDFYSVRVSLASYVPAMKQKILVQPGLQSLLYINLASLFSSVELVYALPGQGALMSDEWKWTLRSSTSTRPILRILPQTTGSISDPNAPQKTANAIFSDTRGLVNVSAGDSGSSGDLSMQPDLGTAFALATSLGRNQLQVSGNVGAARTGVPTASFRTTYSHQGSGPEVTMTIRQVYLPSRFGNALAGGQQDGTPVLRTMSLAMIDRVEITDHLQLEYGLSFDSVSYMDRLNYFSPFARLSYDLGSWGTIRAAYSSGAPPVELFAKTGEQEASLHQDLSLLALAPRISLKGDQARVQRTQSMELGYEKKVGSTTVNVAAYREQLSNAALTLAAPAGYEPEGDLLPNLSPNSGTFNIGSYQRYGYSAGLTESLGDKVEVGVSAGRGGALVAGSSPVDSATADDIRSKIHLGQRYWAAARASATIPVAGTHISTSYEWTDYNNTIFPTHLDLTQKSNADAGWNIRIRQPIPNFPGMPGRLEATAELRNMLAQGYMAIPTIDSRRMLLMQSPRAVRGGLSFIF